MDVNVRLGKAADPKVDRTLELFLDQHSGLPTRMGVFEAGKDGVTDYWLESGLPLAGIVFDRGHRIPACHITVGDITHVVLYVIRLTFHFSLNGGEDGLDVVDQDGRTTILRFEPSKT